MAIWKAQPGHHSKRWFREQKQKQRRSRAEKLFKHLIFQEFSKSSTDSKFKRPSCTKNAVQSQKGLYYQQSNSVSNAAALFRPTGAVSPSSPAFCRRVIGVFDLELCLKACLGQRLPRTCQGYVWPSGGM